MKAATGHILSSSDVKLEGRFYLDVKSVAAVMEKKKDAVPAVQTQARIVESQPQFAVVEITCSCGTKTYFKCEYTDAEPPADEESNQKE